LKIIILGIVLVVLIGSFNIQNSFGHEPDFAVSSTEDILKFCEFFYDEYQLLGAYDLFQQHQNYPNLRGCEILYKHVAWNSTHQARDIVLIAEIEKYLGTSDYIKERHLEHLGVIPEWIKREAQLWINDENQDSDFAYGIRALLESGVIKFNFTEETCYENKICVKEGNFIKYSYSDKYGNNESFKHTIKSIEDTNFTINDNENTVNNSEIMIEIEKISHEGRTKEGITLNSEGIIKTSECCQYYEYIIPLPINLGDSIPGNMKIVAETTYTINDQIRSSWLASDSTNQNIKIIDKKSGLVFSYKHHETKVLTVGEITKITDTNYFDVKYDMESHQTTIPKWWKITTSWLLNGNISETEYLLAIENLMSRNILRV